MKGKYLSVLIAMCGLAASSVGVMVNAAGVFYAPIAESLGTGRGNIAMMITICSIVASMVAMVVPKLIRETNLKLIIIIATVLMAGSTLLYSLCNSLWQLYLLSIIRGFGGGLINFVLITMILNQWFFAKHGVITSIAMAFSGVPGVVLSPIYTSIINSSGWRTAYVAVAASIVLFNLPAILLKFSLRPQTSGLQPYGYEEFQKLREEGNVLHDDRSSAGFSFANPKFILAMIVTIMISIVAAVPQHFPGYATSIGHTAEVGALMLSVSMAFNILSKLGLGVLSDKVGVYKSVMIMVCVNIVGILFLLFINTEFTLYAGAGMFAFAFAVGAVGCAMITGHLFGMEYYSTVYPVLSFVGGIANALAATLVGSLYDVTGTYRVNFWLALGCQIILLIAFNLACLIRKKERRSGIEI